MKTSTQSLISKHKYWSLYKLGASDVKLIKASTFRDARGWLSELYNTEVLDAFDLPVHFYQKNISYTPNKGAIRGIHFQYPPHAQSKIIRATAGRVFSLAVDLRPQKFGEIITAKLDATDPTVMFIPKGFGHGIQTLTDGASIEYELSDAYNPDYLGQIQFFDPAFSWLWPLGYEQANLSQRDKLAKSLAKEKGAFSLL